MGLSSKIKPVRRVLGIHLVVHDLIGGNVSYIDDYIRIYHELFPQYSRYVPIMRQRAETPTDRSANETWHQWLLMIRDEPVGIVGFLYNSKRNTGVLLDFAIRPHARRICHKGKRLAHFCLNLAMQQLILDAQERGRTAPLCMIAEVEYDHLVWRYVEYGFVVLPFEYFEPPTTPELREASYVTENLDKMDYERMYLGAFQIPGHPFNPEDPGVLKSILFTLLKDHYHLPDEHWLVRKMLQDVLE